MWVELVSQSVQSLSLVRLSATPWITACQASLSITNSRSLLELMSIKLVMPSSHLILCRPLLLLPPIPRSIRVFSNESTLRMKWPKYWSFSFSISPSNEHPGLISFRMDWLDLLAIQVSRVDGFKPNLMLVILCWKNTQIVNNEQCTKLTASDIKVHSLPLISLLYYENDFTVCNEMSWFWISGPARIH